MDTKAVKEFARKFGADLVGVAPVERFKGLPADANPLSIFPECKNVIVLARRVLRGSLRGVEEGTNFSSTYAHFGFYWLEDNFLSQTTYDLTCWIEENGFEAVPIFCYFKEGMPKGVPVEQGKPAPNVILDFEFAAQAAGLAELSAGDFLLSNEYGPRQRFALILTDAELDADSVKKPSVCLNCKACAEACPLGAISFEKTTKKGVPGFETEVASIDYELCKRCQNGAINSDRGRGSKPDRMAAACVRTCICQLEKNKKVEQGFENPFRKRKPWQLDILGNIPQADNAGTSAAKGGAAINYSKR